MPRFDAFVARHGRPEPRTEPSVFFVMPEHGEFDWTSFQEKVGCGVFSGGFLQVGTAELPEVNEALAAWTFVLPPDPRRQVVARNAYGDLVLVTHDSNSYCSASVLSPRRARVERPDVRPDLASVLDFYLADRDRTRIPGRPKIHPFLDREVFDEYLAKGGRPPEMDEALVPILPEPLGGKQELSNFRVEKLASYLREAGDVYSRAFTRTTS
jgi:hypothetical protein